MWWHLVSLTKRNLTDFGPVGESEDAAWLWFTTKSSRVAGTDAGCKVSRPERSKCRRKSAEGASEVFFTWKVFILRDKKEVSAFSNSFILIDSVCFCFLQVQKTNWQHNKRYRSTFRGRKSQISNIGWREIKSIESWKCHKKSLVCLIQKCLL